MQFFEEKESMGFDQDNHILFVKINTKVTQPVKTVKHRGVSTVNPQSHTRGTYCSNSSDRCMDVGSSNQTRIVSMQGSVAEGTVEAFITEKEQEEISFNLMQRRKSLPKGSDNLQSLLKEFRQNSMERKQDLDPVERLNCPKPIKKKKDMYVSCKRFPLVCTNRKVGLHHCVHNH
ncbi:hypothetical protein CHS0354_011328 [Potamilus streckersoni]|uniref:Uncharacterized protein n=1 Tax=Potamilus streckersoni TaxID=2493646 RepID=A0AAE0TFN8_9BIVA|nr:hypothetical protein CHS0354_011328 [Potamilus streckersoni]